MDLDWFLERIEQRTQKSALSLTSIALTSEVLEGGALFVGTGTGSLSSHLASFSMKPLLSLSTSPSKRGEREGASFGVLLWWEGKDDTGNPESEPHKPT